MQAAAAAPGAKSPQAFRTISEVAAELDVPQHVLRFWETRFSQVHPLKRAGGRRYYRPEDVELLRGIYRLLYSDGYTIKGVQKLLRERGLRYVAERGHAPISIGPASSRVSVEADDEPRHARAAIARVERAHAESFSGAGADQSAPLDETARVKLELLLAELLQMKARLRAARPRS
jgi:DNA-binding transcriptional MerR regulator